MLYRIYIIYKFYSYKNPFTHGIFPGIQSHINQNGRTTIQHHYYIVYRAFDLQLTSTYAFFLHLPKLQIFLQGYNYTIFELKCTYLGKPFPGPFQNHFNASFYFSLCGPSLQLLFFLHFWTNKRATFLYAPPHPHVHLAKMNWVLM